MITRNKITIEFGDYQTPVAFAQSVCAKLKNVYLLNPAVIFEPTFGTGNFIDSVLSEFESVQAVYGVEVNKEYFAATQQRLFSRGYSHKVVLYNADIFSFNFSNVKERIARDDSILIVGNPPWATNSQLSSMNSCNLPIKENFKGCSGIEAITGKSNFDIAEYIILQLLSEFSGYNCTLAMLCKTTIAKNIIRDIGKYHFSVSIADMYIFNANDVFNVSCDAALFITKLGINRATVCNVYDYYTNIKKRQFGWVNGFFLSDTTVSNVVASIDGNCQFEWRQGIKHDCSKVMELERNNDGNFINGLGHIYTLPIGRFVFPLVKSSDIKTNEIIETKKYIIITQEKVNGDTSIIEQSEKNVWEYLLRYESLLNARRSVIYRNSPKFSIFGVGDYSFSKYKIGISGFYKEPKFALITGDHPIMLDDTCYYLSFNNIIDAVIAVALLNSLECSRFLKSIVFLDSKRPYTKEVLKRIDLFKLANLLSFQYVCDYANSMKSKRIITEEQFINFKNKINIE